MRDSRRPVLRGERIAIIDIGSNSIRLVIHDKAARVLLQVFNEKVMCGLGRGLGETGRLNAEGVARALTNLPRFAAVARRSEESRVGKESVSTCRYRWWRAQ